MLKSIVVSVVIMFIGSNSFAELNSENCNVNVLSSSNLNAETRQHFDQPFDQFSTNLCYSYAAADLLSFQVQRSISPLFLASTMASHSGGVFDALNSGEITEGVLLVNQGVQLCTNAGYSSRVSNVNQLENPSPLRCSGANQLVSFSNQIKLSLYRDCLSGFVPRQTLDDAFKTRVLTDINRELDSGKIVGISLNLNQIKFEKPGLTRLTELAPHAMTIIGRKWVNNRCEYVFRNSYGNDGCGGGSLDSSRVSCTQPEGFPRGTISISEPVLKDALHRVVIIKSASAIQDEVEIITPTFCRPDPNTAARTSSPAEQAIINSKAPAPIEESSNPPSSHSNTDDNDEAD